MISENLFIIQIQIVLKRIFLSHNNNINNRLSLNIKKQVKITLFYGPINSTVHLLVLIQSQAEAKGRFVMSTASVIHFLSNSNIETEV